MKFYLTAICALALGVILSGSCKPACADDTGCILVTGTDTNGNDLTNSDVSIEEDDGHGGWIKPSGDTKKHVGPKDKGQAKLCGLKAGKKYHVIGRKDGDANEGKWQVFVFQPDAKTKQMALGISIKMKEKSKTILQPKHTVKPIK
jgi:hypothetical protein